MKTNDIVKALEQMIPEAKCELVYNKDYELLMATVLSAQSTDKNVNKVTNELFKRYSLEEISNCDLKILEDIIKPVGTFRRKAIYLQEIAKSITKGVINYFT